MFRGWLCPGCNIAAGADFEDLITRARLIAFLARAYDSSIRGRIAKALEREAATLRA